MFLLKVLLIGVIFTLANCCSCPPHYFGNITAAYCSPNVDIVAHVKISAVDNGDIILHNGNDTFIRGGETRTYTVEKYVTVFKKSQKYLAKFTKDPKKIYTASQDSMCGVIFNVNDNSTNFIIFGEVQSWENTTQLNLFNCDPNRKFTDELKSSIKAVRC